MAAAGSESPQASKAVVTKNVFWSCQVEKPQPNSALSVSVMTTIISARLAGRGKNNF
jgi:hypothetical protein